MTVRFHPSWLRRSIGVAVFGLAVIVAAVLSPVGSARTATAAAASKCSAAKMEVWLGDGLGGGVAGGSYYPLEFSNVGRHTCVLDGYPSVDAYGGSGTQVGPAAMHIGQRHRTVTLAPGATAHALLRISDWGALCSTEIQADGLQVAPPGQGTREPIPFPFGVCAQSSVLSVGPVRAGVGIPAYTTS